MIDLIEIDQKVLKQEQKNIVYRFFQDIHHSINLFLWQLQNHPVSGDFGIQKFQFSYREHILELKAGGALKYGMVDEGENPTSIKRSPVMILQTELSKKAFDFLTWYIDQIELSFLPEKSYIEKVFKEHKEKAII